MFENSSETIVSYMYMMVFDSIDHGNNITAAWLAQLEEHRAATWEVEGLSARPDQHSGS